MGHIDAAIAAHQRGDLIAAEAHYRRALAEDGETFNALRMLGILYVQKAQYVDAERLLGSALRRDANSPSCHYSYGWVLAKLGRLDDAVVAFDKAVTLSPGGFPAAHADRGCALLELGRVAEAVESHRQALAADSTYVPAHYNLGRALRRLGRYDEALDSYDRAIAANPAYAVAHVGRGNSLFDLGRHAEALAAHDEAIGITADLAEAWLGRGNTLLVLRRFADALSAYDRAIELNADLAGAWWGRGDILANQRRYDEAILAYDRLLTLDPGFPGGRGARQYCNMCLCDWGDFESERGEIVASLRSGVLASMPGALLAMTSSADDQRRCAERLGRELPARTDGAPEVARRRDRPRIRVAYVSADFRSHPTANLIAELIESHDRERFDIVGVSLLPEDASAMGQRMKKAFCSFVDVSGMPDAAAVRLMRELEIDIAVDLMGYTVHARPNIFAMRGAPIQVNYLGYPGTMGSDCIDYLIADDVTVPNSLSGFYAEKIVRLPVFQPSDRLRQVADMPVSRAQAGLPESGFVFCCFNRNYKITPPVFATWANILRRAPDSVLWLFAEQETAIRNLRTQTRARGIDPERIVFAAGAPYEEYLARYRLADLFLDTHPFNAGATANDALWAGVPILTRIGQAFSGRMAASLLTAVGLTELITASAGDYEALAIELATHADKMAAIRRKLADNRPTALLFDTPRYARNIETAFQIMHRRCAAGLPPDDIRVS